MKQTFWSFQNFIPKIIPCLQKNYSFSSLRKDFMAGLTVGIIAYPFSIAVSIGVGVSPQQGLYASIIGGLVASLLGGSRIMITGPTSTFIAALYAILSRHGPEGLICLTFLAGFFLILFGLMGLGTYIKYIPYPVVAGLTTGIAVIIFSSQIKDFFGLRMGDHVPVDFLGRWSAYWEYLWTWNLSSCIIGLLTIFIILFLRRIKAKIPGVMVALFITSALVAIFDIKIPTIGSRYGVLSSSLPSFHFPALSFQKIIILLPDALTLALLAGMESLLCAVVADGMTGWRHQSNCELVAQGTANICSSLFMGLPVTGSVSRTAANIKAGGNSPISGIVHSFSLIIIVVLFGSLSTRIPLASLAAVLIIVAWGMSDIRHFLHLFTAPIRDVMVLTSVFILTLLTNITAAVQVGMILAAFLFMKQMSDLTDVVSNTSFILDDEKVNQKSDSELLNKQDIPESVEIYEINGPFFFGVVDRLKNVINEIREIPKVFILKMKSVPTIDASGMHALEEFYQTCDKQGTILLLAGIKGSPLRDLQRYHLHELIGEDHIFPTIQSALHFSETFIKLDKCNNEKHELTKKS
ncbi:putative sulfate transporter YvdB [Candidatus Clavichlamydia salmonicola]|uniref:SulP family inorganic anion transporter n=1 Tax=Candidatus Clavichlamydia salmonicola TaxID=469812 RepID=UPI0018918E83|nr:SulP family inorganic anion transporter [Candidatus Clavichlamydia salmonicola]MBF5050428.1 putative sulfate transporter YvdB [Candidatus Clavichlamydia salmonicola]